MNGNPLGGKDMQFTEKLKIGFYLAFLTIFLVTLYH